MALDGYGQRDYLQKPTATPNKFVSNIPQQYDLTQPHCSQILQDREACPFMPNGFRCLAPRQPGVSACTAMATGYLVTANCGGSQNTPFRDQYPGEANG